MNIRQIISDKKRFLPLLLIADEQESMIDRYLMRGEMFVMYAPDSTPVCIAVVTDECDGTCELKNIAVEPERQRHGYGGQMIEWLCRHFGSRYHTMIVGTGDSRQTVSFYKSCGFRYSHTVPDFFTRNYDHPIIEDGKVLKDMVYFERRIFKVRDMMKTERTELLTASLVELWKKSVRISHFFLTDKDIEHLTPLVYEYILNIDHLLVLSQCEKPEAFIGIENRKIEMLFVSPARFRHGFGRELINIAIREYNAVYVDVNEQNPNAIQFYRHLGFKTFERTETDGQGNPFPILKMKLSQNNNL